jgi:hypothetical protein
MPATRASIRDQYPDRVSQVSAGRIGDARETLNRVIERTGPIIRQGPAWDARLAELDRIVDQATPTSDFIAVAAAMAERTVLRKYRDSHGYDERRAHDDISSAQTEVNRLENEYLRLLGFLIDVEEGRARSYYDADVTRARNDLQALAGPPAA